MVEMAVSRPITTVMLFLALLVLGWIAYSRIPVQQLPSGFTPPWMSVVVPYQGGTPREVETQITGRIEEGLRTVEGVDRVMSASTRTGCQVYIRFDGDTDMDVAYAQVTDRMERIRPRLPDDVDAILVRKFNLEDRAIMNLAVYPRQGTRDPEGYLIQNSHIVEELVNRLERLPGVARVQAAGLFEDRVEVSLDQDLVVANKVDLYQVIQRLRRENFNLSSGRITVDGVHYYLRSLARIDDPEKIASLPVREGLRFSDLGEVRHVFGAPEHLSRVNGSLSSTMEVFIEGDANTVETCRTVVAALEEDFRTNPRLAGFEFVVLHDQGKSIEDSLDGLEDSALEGAFLATLVLYVFLRRVGMTLVISLSIPLSLLAALTILYLDGESLNLLSLMGLTLGVGMLVDNSIVVVENIYVRRSEGRSAPDAARLGASEIALAVVISTFTSMVVFLPLTLMADDQMFQFFMSKLGMPVCYSLLASLFVALIFIPLATARSWGAGAARLGESRLLAPALRVLARIDRRTDAAIEGCAGAYAWLLGHCIRRPFDAVLWLLVPAVASTFWVYSRVDQTDQNQELSRDFSVTVLFPDGFSLDEADEATSIIERRILDRKEELEIVDLFTNVNERRSRLNATLTPLDQARRDRREIVAEVESLLPRLPGVDARMGMHWRRTGAADSTVTLVLEGRDSERLAEIAGEVESRLQGLPDLNAVESDAEAGYEEVRIEIDRRAAARYRLEPRSIIGTIQYALRGSQLPDLFAGDREIPLLVRMRTDADFDLERLRNLVIWSQDGQQIPLGAVATLRAAKGFGNIRREDGRTVLTLSAETEEGDLGELAEGIESRLADLHLPPGYSWRKAGRFDEWRRNQESFQFAVVLAILFVFLLMGVLFESFLLPLAVLVSIPFAFTGVYWVHYLTDTPLGIMSFIGIIILVGVVVNNGVVLVDLINRLRLEGVDRHRAIVQGCRSRLRPILMTAGTTIVGLLPMAFGTSAVADVPYYPLGRSLMGGLAASTLFTLFLVPVLYRVLDDVSTGLRTRVAALVALVRR